MITSTFSGSGSPREAWNCDTACCKAAPACEGFGVGGAGLFGGVRLGFGLAPGLGLWLGFGVGGGDCGITPAELGDGGPGVGGGAGLERTGLGGAGVGLVTGMPVYAALETI